MPSDTAGLFDDELLTTAETAKLLRLSAPTLERMRTQGGSGLRFIKLGTGKRAKVVYRRRAVEDWLDAQQFSSTSEFKQSGE